MILYAHQNNVIHFLSSTYLKNFIIDQNIFIYFYDNIDLVLIKTKVANNSGSIKSNLKTITELVRFFILPEWKYKYKYR